jgi:hypothetical protein
MGTRNHHGKEMSPFGAFGSFIIPTTAVELMK